MSSDQSDQLFGNLAISSEFCGVGTMPWKCMFVIDEEKPENCRVNFDANLYDRKEMHVMLDRYLRLLEAAARGPELPIRKLLMMAGPRPLRWRRKLRGTFSRVYYSSLRLVAAIEDV